MNLYFYKIIKTLIKTHLTEIQLIKLQTIVLKNKENYNANEMQEYLLNTGIVKENTSKYKNYQNLINLINHNNYNAWISMIDISIDLILFKNLILEEAKIYIINKEIKNDKLNLYTSRLCTKYTLTNNERETMFLMNSSNKTIKEIQHKLKYITNNYNINYNNIMPLIVNNSTN